MHRRPLREQTGRGRKKRTVKRVISGNKIDVTENEHYKIINQRNRVFKRFKIKGREITAMLKILPIDQKLGAYGWFKKTMQKLMGVLLESRNQAAKAQR